MSNDIIPLVLLLGHVYMAGFQFDIPDYAKKSVKSPGIPLERKIQVFI